MTEKDDTLSRQPDPAGNPAGKDMAEGRKEQKSRTNARIALGLALFVGCMVGLAYASVPLYNLFCRVTGYGGTTQTAQEEAATILDRTVTIRFDANVAGGLNWQFKPATRPLTIKVGETAEANYEVVNLGKATTSGTATFNVTPQAAGIYFNKLDCFCFTDQTVKAGEHVTMPVVFFVDPDIDKDPNMAFVKTITLSYTFFPEEEETAALAPSSDKGSGTPSADAGAEAGQGS